VQQHLVCQGFLEDETRQHVCHLCLLHDEANKGDLMEQLQELALKRRAMDMLLSEQVGDATELSRRLSMFCEILLWFSTKSDIFLRHAN
jgi:hypothetical protein